MKLRTTDERLAHAQPRPKKYANQAGNARFDRAGCGTPPVALAIRGRGSRSRGCARGRDRTPFGAREAGYVPRHVAPCLDEKMPAGPVTITPAASLGVAVAPEPALPPRFAATAAGRRCQEPSVA